MTEEKTRRIIKAVAGIVVILIILFVFTKACAKSIAKAEQLECQKWAEQAKQYPDFYLTSWQKAQCNHHNIEVIKEGKGIQATIYAYNADPAQTDDRPEEMASGKKVYVGAIACPNLYTFGTKVEIDGQLYTCEDRMAERYRKTNTFDIFMPTLAEALAWGKQNKEVVIYEP